MSTTIVVATEYGNFIPFGYLGYPKPVLRRTEVVAYPSDPLISLSDAKGWLDQEDVSTADTDINGLLLAASNFICGPNSETQKCFRKWHLRDVWEVQKAYDGDSFALRFDQAQSIVNVKYQNIFNPRASEQTIPASKYIFRNGGSSRKSFLTFIDDAFEPDESLEYKKQLSELRIEYMSSSPLNNALEPIIDPLALQLCKHLITEGFEKDGMTYGPSQGAGVRNKYVENIIKLLTY